jgi:inorganic phosphate transporter, PiT family
MGLEILLIISILFALAFDVVNGFHDAANSIATVVSTRVLKPFQAVIWAAFFNFIAMLFFPAKVAETIATIVKINPQDPIFVYVIIAGLIGAIFWGILTWWLGLPTSSSHALIGGLAGAGISYGGWGALDWTPLIETMIFIIVAPLLGLILGFIFMLCLFWLFKDYRPTIIDGYFRKGQLISAALYSIGHGANDAQKIMGVILALLIAGNVFPQDTFLSLWDPKTMWIIFACHLAMAIGTALGGWRIVKTLGMKITKLKPIGGFCAETAGTLTLFLATYFGIPVSTTHTITGAIIGVGTVSTPFSGVKWGIAKQIAWAWILTIPATGVVGGIIFLIFKRLYIY